MQKGQEFDEATTDVNDTRFREHHGLDSPLN
jgi:hypothetical protein